LDVVIGLVAETPRDQQKNGPGFLDAFPRFVNRFVRCVRLSQLIDGGSQLLLKNSLESFADRLVLAYSVCHF
jgi:hypothetical protein